MNFEELTHLVHSVKSFADTKAMKTLNELISATGELGEVAMGGPSLTDKDELVDIACLCSEADRFLF
jgi:hypothetical protein